MDINGDAIYATRIWDISEEGPVRFTRSKDGKALYAIALEWPQDNTLSISALAAGNRAGKVSSVSMLGYDGSLDWEQTGNGLLIALPDTRPCENAWSFRIVF